MTGPAYIDLLVAELTTVTITDGPRRRSGTDALFADCLGYVRRDLDWVKETLGKGGTPASDTFVTGAVRWVRTTPPSPWTYSAGPFS